MDCQVSGPVKSQPGVQLYTVTWPSAPQQTSEASIAEALRTIPGVLGVTYVGLAWVVSTADLPNGQMRRQLIAAAQHIADLEE